MPANVSIFTTTEGHWSISEAIGQLLESNNYHVNYNKHEGFEFQFYRQIYKHKPELFRYFYRLGQNRLGLYMTKQYSQYNYKSAILDQVKEQNPDVIISCWYLLNPILQQIAEEKDIPMINIVANPRTIHPLEVNPYIYNLVFDQKAKEIISEFKMNPMDTRAYGWFVRSEFEREYHMKKVRDLLYLSQDQFVIVMQSGSEGTNATLKVFDTFIKNLPENVYVIFIAGKNKSVFKKAAQKANSQIEVLGYTNHMPTYIQAADIVVGKAGPNTLFEAVATKTPFLATNHIHGQEDGNLNIITDYQVGFVESDPKKASALLTDLANDPNQLKKFQPHIKKLAEFNKSAKSQLMQLIEKKLHEAKN